MKVDGAENARRQHGHAREICLHNETFFVQREIANRRKVIKLDKSARAPLRDPLAETQLLVLHLELDLMNVQVVDNCLQSASADMPQGPLLCAATAPLLAIAIIREGLVSCQRNVT